MVTPSNRSVVIGSLSALAIILAMFAFHALTASAGNTTPAQVADTVADISKNQARIAGIRQYVDEFNKLKADNEALVTRLNAWGFDFDWATGTAKSFQ